MKVHELKTWPIYFNQIKSGNKTFEVRKNDRDFMEGDRLILKEWDNNSKGYVYSNPIICDVTSIIYSFDHFGLKNKYCIMSIKIL